MQISLNDGGKPEYLALRIQNADTVTLPVYTPVYVAFTTTADQRYDGVAVQRPSVALAAGTGYYYGLVITPGGLLPGQYGDAVFFGVVYNVPVICNTRANVGTAYSTHIAILPGSGLTVDTTNNYLTGMTLITKSQSNVCPAIALDNIPADQGNGTTPAAGLFLTYPIRVLITFK